MFRILKAQKTCTSSLNKGLYKNTLRYSSNYYGVLSKFRFTDKDFQAETPVQRFIEKYRKHGHHFSKVDPLKLAKEKKFPGLADFSLDQATAVKNQVDSTSFINKLNLENIKQLEEFLAKAYTSSVGVQFDHVEDAIEREWLYNQYEEIFNGKLSHEEKKKILELLIKGEAIDHFLTKKYQTFKRYSGEGTESLLVALNTIFADASQAGVTDIVLAMPHRGRFNVLLELLDYPAENFFAKVSGASDIPDEVYTAIDDVPSHIAASVKKVFSKGTKEGGSKIRVTQLHNPSHLEAVNPVGMGKTKAKQDEKKNTDQVFNVQLHGDAAFAAQGVIYESFALSKTPNFNIDGTIHIICNNQLGFTTIAKEGRSTEYSSDIVKPYGVPVIHVNADCPEEVAKVAELAVKYRQKFKKDFMIDLIGYRRYGHNELDEPEFTQPLMYKQIKQQVTSSNLYLQSLIAEGSKFSEEEFNKIRDAKLQELETSYRNRESVKLTVDTVTNEGFKGNRAFTEKWKDCTFSVFGKEEKTGFDIEALKKFTHASITTPSDFEVHPRLQKFHIQSRLQSIEKNAIDWPAAEAAAFASLLTEGYNIRFTGQDVERGTFSHRHLVFTDFNSEKKYSPLNQKANGYTPKGHLTLGNSCLSETGVLSYEYGYSLESPQNLVLWEAQFGDFFNTAQVAFDTYITCSEAKWMRQSGLVVMLPHGIDGAGPEHSSSRIERFLSMGSSDGQNRNLTLKDHDPSRAKLSISDKSFYENHQDVNFQFAFPSTPANYFHLLRRQVKRNFRKPLILAAPKILLKHPLAKSSFEEMGPDTAFNPLYVHQGEGNSLDTVETVIFCSGRIQYDIRANLNKDPAKWKKYAVFIVEELLPFPEKIIKEKLSQVSKSAKVVWVQEESINNGVYWYAEPRISRVLRELEFENQNFECVARRSTASIAVGNVKQHMAEAQELMGIIKSFA